MASVHALRCDLLSAKVLVWIASVGRDADLTDDAHRFFADRYGRLAAHHRGRGHHDKARRLQDKADAHALAGGDGPPYAAAMAMPRPRRFVHTDAVSHHFTTPPDDAA